MCPFHERTALLVLGKEMVCRAGQGGYHLQLLASEAQRRFSDCPLPYYLTN